MKNKILKIIKWYFIYHFIIDLCFLVIGTAPKVIISGTGV